MLSRLEPAFESIVEQTISGTFRLRVQPAEIGRRLERAMLDGRVTSVGTPLAPTVYEVQLHPDDAATFADWQAALCRELESWLAELAFARGLATVGPIRVGILETVSVRRRSVRATARFDASAGRAATNLYPAQQQVALLRLVSASADVPDALLAAGSFTIGRAAGNDLVIDNPVVSRHHARLVGVNQHWHVVDLGSTNGTWLNHACVSGADLVAGDVLAFGCVRFSIEYA